MAEQLTEEMRRELIASWTALIEEWQNSAENPGGKWCARAAGALTAARALLAAGVALPDGAKR